MLCYRRNSTRIVLALLLVLPAAALAQEGIAGFEPVGGLLLEVEGEDDPGARVLQSKSPPAYLVISDRLRAPVLLEPQNGSVHTVQLLKMAEKPDGTIDLLSGARQTPQGTFRIEGVDEGLKVHFLVGTVAALLKPKPYLLGFQRLDQMRSYSPEYQRRESAYAPSGPMLAKLRDEGREVRVRVFFGSWCPACGQLVPRIMKVAEELRGSRFNVEFYGLPKPFNGEPQASRYNIESVPTGVVFVDGEEVGRITGNGWRIPELTLTNLLQGS